MIISDTPCYIRRRLLKLLFYCLIIKSKNSIENGEQIKLLKKRS